MRLQQAEQGTHMSSRQFARLTFLVEPDLKQEFEELCAAQDITASQLMRQLLRTHVAAHRSSPEARSKPQKPDGSRRK
jgi:hypothetical protein